MPGRDRPIANLTAGDSSVGTAVGVLKTAVAIVGVFVALGLVARAVYDVLSPGLAFPGLLVALAVLGFGGLYAVLRVRDWLG